ncbi:MAG: YdcF family protein [Calditrichaeota bacterium]|nr:MAG: YdcF family protein [Calditrichota bacterium]MBL1204417.1 YdcF family protein [Calditrichota bacterium]NOG44246.1 YdcF family protein [Calditrichota bacterium]
MRINKIKYKKAAIVLGGGIKITKDPEHKRVYEPENQVKDRLGKALQLYLDGQVGFIITTGNYSKRVGIDSSVIGPKNEAEVGKEYLLQNFVTNSKTIKNQFAAKILFEKKSLDTIGNAWFSKQECLIPNNIKECIIITSDFHLERSKLCFDWVLGPEYKIDYIGLDSDLKDNPERRKVEDVFSRFMREQLINSISAGDDEQIGKFMKTEHLVYCMSERSEAQFNACMETASITAGY